LRRLGAAALALRPRRRLQAAERDARLIGGGEGDEPGMILQTIVDLAGVVLLGARDREHLGGAGLAAAKLSAACAPIAAAVRGGDPRSCRDHELPVSARSRAPRRPTQGDALQLPVRRSR